MWLFGWREGREKNWWDSGVIFLCPPKCLFFKIERKLSGRNLTYKWHGLSNLLFFLGCGLVCKLPLSPFFFSLWFGCCLLLPSFFFPFFFLLWFFSFVYVFLDVIFFFYIWFSFPNKFGRLLFFSFLFDSILGNRKGQGIEFVISISLLDDLLVNLYL